MFSTCFVVKRGHKQALNTEELRFHGIQDCSKMLSAYIHNVPWSYRYVAIVEQMCLAVCGVETLQLIFILFITESALLVTVDISSIYQISFACYSWYFFYLPNQLCLLQLIFVLFTESALLVTVDICTVYRSALLVTVDIRTIYRKNTNCYSYLGRAIIWTDQIEKI